MKHFTSLLLCILFVLSVFANQKYEATIDLKKIRKDKVFVTVKVPSCATQIATWCMPAIVPGTYAKYDYGRFITNFKAYNNRGKRLKTQRKNSNEFLILNALELASISYKVNDTWDASSKNNYVFQPAGTNIEKNKNVVLNHFGFVGYLADMQNYNYEITIKKPSNFKASTSLKVKNIDPETDLEFANNYLQLADSPTLYCNSDTLTFKCKNTNIHIDVYSSQGIVNAKKIQRCISPLANALALFFNQLPINDYHFLFYFSGTNDHKVWGTGASGALEHNYSSFYFLPEIEDTVTLYSLINDIAAHEFLHILTPLNIHSYEIENFDFIAPKMSEHLWMYEGVTEYFSHLVQVRSGLITEQELITTMENKIKASNEYPVFSFTDMSKNVCIAPFKDYFENVYQKGALLAFLLDIELTTLSNNKFGLFELMNSLTLKYGPNKPFIDSTLFDEITQATHPKIKDFFNRYIIEKDTLPYAEYLKKIGWTYNDSITDSVYYFGKFGFMASADKNGFKVVKTEEDRNYFGLKNKDNLLSIDGKNVDNNPDVLDQIFNPKTNNKLQLEVLRNGKKIQLDAKPNKRNKIKYNSIHLQTDFTKQQKDLRNKLFGNNNLKEQ